MKHLKFRPIAPKDEVFLNQLYASTRQEEMALTGWAPEKIKEFLDFQFKAQHAYYQEAFPKASFQLILLKNRPIGRLYIDRRVDEIRIVDIALLPDHRGKGIGKTLMQGVLKEGEKNNLPVRIHVEHNNPAMRLYERLGFRRSGDTGVYYLMEWEKAFSNS